LKDGFVVNTILKEADLFCPNSVRINFTIYQLNDFISLYVKHFQDNWISGDSCMAEFVSVEKADKRHKRRRLSAQLPAVWTGSETQLRVLSAKPRP
ncbi:hypothetical protein, partial [Lentilactobacillus buchneri]